MNKKTLSKQSIIDCLQSEYSITVSEVTQLPLGADVQASIYKAAASNDAFYFVKVKQGSHADFGVAILTLLRTAGIEHIIPPVKTIHGEVTHFLDSHTLVVYPFIEGKDGFTRKLSNEQWVELGSVLRQVHTTKVPASVKARMRKENYSAKWRDAVRAIDASIDQDLHTDEVGAQLQAHMKGNRTVIRHLVDRADYLSDKVQKIAPEMVLCHSDIHGGNVLIDNNDAIYIVDWDEPIMAPKERDLMFIGAGVANTWNDPREVELFYQGYGGGAVEGTILAYYRYERIVEDIAVYGQELLLQPSAGGDRQTMYQEYMDMFDPEGVVEIACRTDEMCR